MHGSVSGRGFWWLRDCRNAKRDAPSVVLTTTPGAVVGWYPHRSSAALDCAPGRSATADTRAGPGPGRAATAGSRNGRGRGGSVFHFGDNARGHRSQVRVHGYSGGGSAAFRRSEHHRDKSAARCFVFSRIHRPDTRRGGCPAGGGRSGRRTPSGPGPTEGCAPPFSREKSKRAGPRPKRAGSGAAKRERAWLAAVQGVHGPRP